MISFHRLNHASDSLRPLHVVGLLGEPQHPARHRYRHPHRGAGGGHLTDEREDYFGGVMCACDRYAAARRSTSFSCSNSRTRLSALETSRRSSVSTGDRKSTRLNSSHVASSYAVFCLKK